MQQTKMRTIMWACVAGFMLATLSLGLFGLRSAQAQASPGDKVLQVVPSQTKVLLLAPSQTVDRIEDGSGNNLGSGRVQANIHVSDDGSAKGQSRMTLQDTWVELTYETGTVSYNDAGEIIRMTLSGQGVEINTAGRVPFMFTADVDVHSDPDDLIFDILGSDVYDGIHFQAEGMIKVISGG